MTSAKIMRILNIVTGVLVIVGALNWFLIGAFNWNLVGSLFGSMGPASRLVYILVGLSGMFQLARLPAVSYCYLHPIKASTH